MKSKQTTHADALLEACNVAGSKAALAAAINVSAQRLNNWIKRDQKVPAEFCADIERLFGISRRDLRPHDYWIVWPDLQQQEAAHA